MKFGRDTITSVFVRYDGTRSSFNQSFRNKRYHFSKESRYAKIPMEMFNKMNRVFPGYLSIITEDAYKKCVNDIKSKIDLERKKRIEIAKNIELRKQKLAKDAEQKKKENLDEVKKKLGLKIKKNVPPPSRGKVGTMDGPGHENKKTK